MRAEADEILFRPPTPEDAEPVAHLLGELGYPAAVEEIPGRLRALTHFPAALALVATANGEVVGLITSHVFPSIHSAHPVAWITSLVVSTTHRGKGVGSALVARAEQWAADNGAMRVGVKSGLQREATHRFYEHRDYQQTGLRFAKAVDSVGRSETGG